MLSMINIMFINTYSFVSDVWQLRDETSNFEQKHDTELIKEAKRYRVLKQKERTKEKYN